MRRRDVVKLIAGAACVAAGGAGAAVVAGGVGAPVSCISKRLE